MDHHIINNKNLWERFVLSQQPNSFLQSWNWGVVEENLGNKVIRTGFYENHHLVGVAQFVQFCAKRGRFLHCRNGPIFKNLSKEKILEFLNFIKELAIKEKVNFVRFSPLIKRGDKNKKLFKIKGLYKAPIHNMDAEVSCVLPLNQAEEQILYNMRKTTRYLIRKSLRLGIEVYEDTTKKGFDLFSKLYKKTVERAKFAQHKNLEEEFNVFSKDKKLLLLFAKYKEQIYSSAMIILYGDQAIYHHAANVITSQSMPTSHAIVWQAILKAKEKGRKNFNFWGVIDSLDKNHPWYGLTLFKKGFGGKLVHYIHARDYPINFFYWRTYILELLIKEFRGYGRFKSLQKFRPFFKV